MENQYISIKEFAEVVGMTQQGIYKQLNSKLKEYVTTINGKKMLDKSALDLFEIEDCLETDDKKLNNGEQLLNEVQQQIIELLKSELEQKNEQIKEKDKQIADLLVALSQAQQLQAMNQQRILELEDKKQVVEVAEPEPQKKRWTFWK